MPVRQWVLTLPIELRYRIAYDGKVCSEVLAVFLRAVSGWYRRQARDLGQPDGRTGAISVIQRANSDLRLAPHFHSLLLDGVYVRERIGASPRFVATPAPADHEIKKLVETIARRVIRLLVRRGVLDEAAEVPDRLAEEEPVLAGLLRASVLDMAITGERAGRRIRRVLSDPGPGQRTGDLCFASRRRRIPWAELLRRVFRVDIEQCHCGGRLRLVAFVTDPVEVRRYLTHVGLPFEMQEIVPARAPPQLDFESC